MEDQLDALLARLERVAFQFGPFDLPFSQRELAALEAVLAGMSVGAIVVIAFDPTGLATLESAVVRMEETLAARRRAPGGN